MKLNLYVLNEKQEKIGLHRSNYQLIFSDDCTSLSVFAS